MIHDRATWKNSKRLAQLLTVKMLLLLYIRKADCQVINRKNSLLFTGTVPAGSIATSAPLPDGIPTSMRARMGAILIKIWNIGVKHRILDHEVLSIGLGKVLYLSVLSEIGCSLAVLI